jgi:predicted metal-dependent HD superfamily phosphohydrolase
MPTLEQWRATWTGLDVAAPADLYDRLIACYSEPHRKYHTPLHLDECLAKFSGVRSQSSHPEEIELAIWFHDAIYDTKRKDNEERSAQWAGAAMLDARLNEERAERVRRLIMVTCHDAIPAGADAQILVDVDLSILGAAKDRFDEYERQVREEYGWVPDALFRRERKKILKSFLKRPRIYSTQHFRETHERPARENLRRSLERLDSRGKDYGPMSGAGRLVFGGLFVLIAAWSLFYAHVGGMPWWLAGLLTSVLFPLGAFYLAVPPPYYVDELQITAEGVTRHFGSKLRAKKEERVSWDELTKVEIQTTDSGPFAEDFYFLLHGDNGKGVAVSNGVAVKHQLLKVLQERLPGLDNGAVIAASGSTDNRSFLIWERPAQRRIT